MKTELKIVILVFLAFHKYTTAQTSVYDSLLPYFRQSTSLLLQILGHTSEDPDNLSRARQLNILQPTINKTVTFPCSLNNMRSTKRPTNVNFLRPGDIDIIGALGDSLTAGNGVAATDVSHIAVQNRGLSPVIGGQESWKKFLTLPNILKELNPNLYGYSTKDSFVDDVNSSKFNVAEAFAISSDMPFMTNQLIKRMKEDTRVNISLDWKMITFVIGSNDFCAHMCYLKNPESIIESHRKDLTQVLRLLRDNLPRTIVNIIPNPHLKLIRTVTTGNRPPICYITHNFLCPCLFGLQFKNQQDRFDQIMTNWQKLQIEIANQSEFDRDDFTVVVQPFILNYKLSTNKNGLTDYSSLSRDCFHLSQKESSKVALSLWNNLLEPVGSKSTEPAELFHFNCPSLDNPYIFTRKNSEKKLF